MWISINVKAMHDRGLKKLLLVTLSTIRSLGMPAVDHKNSMSPMALTSSVLKFLQDFSKIGIFDTK